jgi:hypothetical protein
VSGNIKERAHIPVTGTERVRRSPTQA